MELIHNFLFHRVSPDRDPLWDPMDPALFERCIRTIRNRFEVCLAEDIYSDFPFNSKSRIATISFDDGYLDNLEYAAPILAKYNCRASFYVVTDCISKGTLTWTHCMDYGLLITRAESIALDFDFVPERLKKLDLKNAAHRVRMGQQLKPFMRTISHIERMQLLATFVDQIRDVKFPTLMMGWEQVKQLKSAGHCIGSHTATHPMLGTMEDMDEVQRELTSSSEQIRMQLGYAPVSLAYPVGSYNERVMNMARQCGYRFAFAVNQDLYKVNQDDVFAIPRIELYNEPWWKTSLRINHHLERIKKWTGYR